MKLLTLAQLRFLRLAPWSTLTVFLGVALGVSSIVAVHQISQGVVASLDAATPTYLRSISHLLDKPGLKMEDYFRLRARWRAGELPEIEQLMPVVEGVVSIGGKATRLVGLDAFSGVRETLVLAPLPPDQLIVGAAGDLTAGDGLELGGRSFTVAATHDSVPEGVALTDIGSAQLALGLPDEALTRIGVGIAGPRRTLLAWSDRFLPGFAAGFAAGTWELDGWRVRGLDAELPGLAFARSILFNLGALGSLALVVAWLLVYQVGLIWLRRRKETLVRLRQMGVTEGELLRDLLLGLCGLGFCATVLGIWIGDLLADGLVRLVAPLGTDRPGSAAAVDGWLLLKAFGSATLVGLLGGWLAYRRESRPPPTALRNWLLVVLIVLIGGAGVLLSDSLLGGFASIGAAALLVLVVVLPLLRWLRGASGRIGGPILARAGIRDLVWYPEDLAVAVGALALAIATSVAIGLMVESFRLDFQRMLDRRLVHDIYVDGDGRDLAPLGQALARQLLVDRVQAYGRMPYRIGGMQVDLGYTRFDASEASRYGLRRALRLQECLVSERLARALNLSAGSTLDVDGHRFEVAGTFAGYGDPVPRLLVDDEAVAALGLPLRHDRLSISASNPAAVLSVIAREHADLTVQAQGSMRQTALRIFDQTFAITRALTFLALLVASAGLYNALLALKLLQQRTRELLHAMGASAAEVRSVGRWRLLGVGVVSLALALPLGLLMGWLLCRVINPRAFGWSLNLSLEPTALLWPVLSAALVMALVALLPAPEEGLTDEF